MFATGGGTVEGLTPRQEQVLEFIRESVRVNGYPPTVAIVGEFLPSAGPNMIFAAILVPILVVAYNSIQKQAGR